MKALSHLRVFYIQPPDRSHLPRALYAAANLWKLPRMRRRTVPLRIQRRQLGRLHLCQHQPILERDLGARDQKSPWCRSQRRLVSNNLLTFDPRRPEQVQDHHLREKAVANPVKAWHPPHQYPQNAPNIGIFWMSSRGHRKRSAYQHSPRGPPCANWNVQQAILPRLSSVRVPHWIKQDALEPLEVPNFQINDPSLLYPPVCVLPPHASSLIWSKPQDLDLKGAPLQASPSPVHHQYLLSSSPLRIYQFQDLHSPRAPNPWALYPHLPALLRKRNA